MKGHHDESKLAVQTPPQEMHSQHILLVQTPQEFKDTKQKKASMKV